jgi:hypothetical protein
VNRMAQDQAIAGRLAAYRRSIDPTGMTAIDGPPTGLTQTHT